MNHYQVVFTIGRLVDAMKAEFKPFNKDDIAAFAIQKDLYFTKIVEAKTAEDAVTITQISEGDGFRRAVILSISAVEQPGSSPSS